MMHRKQRGSGSATAIAIVLVGIGLAAGWFAVAPAVFGAGASPYVPSFASPAAQPAPQGAVAPLASGQALTTNLQTSQPRDPFRPLIFVDGGNFVGPGSGGRNGIIFKVISIDVVENTPPIVNVELNGTSYSVGVGDTFGGAYKVISITPPVGNEPGRAVFLFGDNAFEVIEGQEILK